MNELDFPVIIPDGPMKALSLWQPWASLVARGVKRHDTRTWTTEHRGLVAIHASKVVDLAGAPNALCRAALDMFWWATKHPASAVVAVARLTACRAAPSVEPFVTRADRAATDFSAGRFALVFDEIHALYEPIPLAGRQGLFNWTPPPDLAARLGPRLDHGAICRSIGWGVGA